MGIPIIPFVLVLRLQRLPIRPHLLLQLLPKGLHMHRIHLVKVRQLLHAFQPRADLRIALRLERQQSADIRCGRDQRQIRHAHCIADHVRRLRQERLQKCERPMDFRQLLVGGGRSAFVQDRSDDFASRRKQAAGIEVHALIDLGATEGIAARIERMIVIAAAVLANEIRVDGVTLADGPAVRLEQRRHGVQRVDGEEPGLVLFAGAEVDRSADGGRRGRDTINQYSNNWHYNRFCLTQWELG